MKPARALTLEELQESLRVERVRVRGFIVEHLRAYGEAYSREIHVALPLRDRVHVRLIQSVLKEMFDEGLLDVTSDSSRDRRGWLRHYYRLRLS